MTTSRHFRRAVALAGITIAAVIMQGRGGDAQQDSAPAEWRTYGGDKAFTRYSPLDQINRDNVKNLHPVWRRPAVDDRLTRAFPDVRVSAYLRSTPIMIDGMLFTQDAHGFISAFDP